MRRRAALVMAVFCLHASFAKAQSVMSSERTVDTRVQELVAQMTLEEKIAILGGTGFDTKPIPRLGIPAVRMTDGPTGVRAMPSTTFPAPVGLAASFNAPMLQNAAEVMAEETLHAGRHLLLGPCVNIHRTPFGGRNFESYGEDPFLSSQMAVAWIHGAQSKGVIESVKHFAVNDQEYERMKIDVRVGLRPLMEIHLPAFEAAVNAGVSTVMASYNKVNGQYASENSFLLKDILKSRWGFQGFVVSDWEATHSVVDAANNGLDLEMPFGLHFGDPLLQAVRSGLVSEATINDKVTRILRVIVRHGLMDSTVPRPAKGPQDASHQAMALRAARESLVLLKNAPDLLPLSTSKIKTVALIGPNAAVARTGGGGSSRVEPLYKVSPLEGVRKLVGSQVQVRYAIGQRYAGDLAEIDTDLVVPDPEVFPGTNKKGFAAEFFSNKHLQGPAVVKRVDAQLNFDFGWGGSPDEKIPTEGFSARWSGLVTAPATGAYELYTRSDDGVRLYLDDQLLIDNWTNHGEMLDTASVQLQEGRTYKIRVEYFQDRLGAKIVLGWKIPGTDELREAVELARTSDVAVIFTGLGTAMESEGFDRSSLDLPAGQNELIEAVVRANPNTVVVLNAGSPLLVNAWLPQIPSVLFAPYGGQEGGTAIAEALFGYVNPSGHLPFTWLKRWEDSPAYGNYPGQNGQVEYNEGIFVGYRHFDKQSIEPAFPFGHGLSYTSFVYSASQVNVQNDSVQAPRATLKVRVRNNGPRAGYEVVQVYMHPREAKVERAVQELKGFQKVYLLPGEEKEVEIPLDQVAFRYFDETTEAWKVDPGLYELRVGASSRDIRARNLILLR